MRSAVRGCLRPYTQRGSSRLAIRLASQPADSENPPLGEMHKLRVDFENSQEGIQTAIHCSSPRALNKHLRKYKFKMLTHASLLRFLRPGDWFTSINLKDAYFHIPIYPPHRKYLRFAFRGNSYEYLVLPFGLSLSPRVFVKCTETAVGPLRRRGIRVATYIDDWLIASSSHQEATQHTAVIKQHLMDLGFKINPEKSSLLPSQRTSFIGLSLNSIHATESLTEDRVKAMVNCLSRFQRGNLVSFRLCRRLLGLMVAALVVIPLGRLHMRGIQRWVASQRLKPHTPQHMLRVTAACTAALRPWRNRDALTQGVPMGVVQNRKVVTTDASLSGWGGICERQMVNGTWGPKMQFKHINYMELKAVHLTLKHFLPILRAHHVLIRSDNTTVVAYINRQGGLRSLRLHTLAHKLIIWSSRHFLSLRATHVPGVLNCGADLLSRGNPTYAEWKLHPEVARMIWQRFGQPSVDLFASQENNQCPMFFSLHDRNSPLGVDALAHPWPRTLLYEFPPIALISPTLARVRAESLTMILIAPNWPAKHWLAEITQLLWQEPWPLPARRDLLSQARGQIFHPHPERLALWAWPVSGLTYSP
ncbi:uncharacterized protein LOC118567149 [Fundulus heteroclitus]|uniref:uncharacterized protein LOC118567149 n=1 Tax=Fundulus heteroclitus TaxID=8078 RepID=UPI00165A40E8|nr:uncharacterized protein LOC118567149 [Fundulus heteroclitus]